MKWLFKRFLYAINDINKELNPHDEKLERLCEEFGEYAKIHILNKKTYGSVYSNEEFARMVTGEYIIDSDGIGYYVGTDLKETEEYVDFDEKTIRSKVDKYPYVFWFNK